MVCALSFVCKVKRRPVIGCFIFQLPRPLDGGYSPSGISLLLFDQGWRIPVGKEYLRLMAGHAIVELAEPLRYRHGLSGASGICMCIRQVQL